MGQHAMQPCAAWKATGIRGRAAAGHIEQTMDILGNNGQTILQFMNVPAGNLISQLLVILLFRMHVMPTLARVAPNAV